MNKDVFVRATNYDGAHHWSHPASLVDATDAIVITSARAGLEVTREDGTYVSPFNTRGHYWPDRWYNVIRLEEPGKGLVGYYCNIASPVTFDGETVGYIDLQLDVRVFVNARGALTWSLRDEDEFEVARVRYAYPDALIARCYAAVDQVVTAVEARAFPFDG